MSTNEDSYIEAELLAELQHLHREIARLTIREAKVSAALSQFSRPERPPRPGWPFRPTAPKAGHARGEEPLH